MSALDTEPWITARLAISVRQEAVSDVKQLLRPRAKKLRGWKVVVEEDERVTESGESFMRVALQPGPKARISPRKLLAAREQVVAAARAFMQELGARKVQVFHDPFSGIEALSATKEDLEGYWCFAFKARGVPYTNVLTFTFLSATRVEFDRQFPELAKKLFSSTVDELVPQYTLRASWWQRLWRGKSYVDALDRSRDRFKNWFGMEYSSLE